MSEPPQDGPRVSLRALQNERMVSLTSFEDSGEPTTSVLWVVAETDGLAISVPAKHRAVSRLRNDSRVELRAWPSPKTERPPPVARGTAEVLDDEHGVRLVQRSLRQKYGPRYLFTALVERVTHLGRPADRVILRITEARD